MTALRQKLLRDLRSIRGQVITIALVIAGGVAAYASFAGTFRTLSQSLARYYEDSRFGDVFAHLKRAPDTLLERIANIPGVAQAEGRLVEDIRLDLPSVEEPAFGVVLSHPRGGPLLDALHLRAGRLAEPGEVLEAVVNEGFARAHDLAPGGFVPAVLDGKRTRLRIAGIAISPEFVVAVPRQGGSADDATFGVFWMDRDVLARAFRKEGSFDDVVLRLSPGASAEAVIERLDRILDPFGGTGAHARDHQPSHRVLETELRQLRVDATVAPLVFLLVAAFLVNVVLSRLIGTQREQIAALKALGYSDREVAVHFLELVLVVVLLGGALGIGLGAVLGKALTDLYARYFRFPTLGYRLDLVSAATSLVVACVPAFGSLFAVRKAARLPPAEGMRPPAPNAFRPLILDRVGLSGLLSQASRMVVRDVERVPLRLAASVIGIGAAISVLIGGRFSGDSLALFFDKQFRLIQREDVAVEFGRSVPAGAVHELEAIPGVLRAEPVRYVPVRLRSGHLRYDTAVQGLGRDADLRRIVDASGRPIALPSDALFVSPELARRLELGRGDEVRLETLDGTGRTRTVRVAGTFDEVISLMPAMERGALDRLLGDPPTATGAALAVDPAQSAAVAARLKEFPLVTSAVSLPRVRRLFEEQNTDVIRAITAILVVFAAAITVGVVYNDARVALAVRGRDLATLRVLGYTRREVSGLFVRELAVTVVLGIPVGLLLGNLVVAAFASGFETESYHLEAVVSAQTRAFAVAVALASAAASAVLVERRLDTHDLVGVLKARD
ncbi:MAG: ABC transporter permease [Myxococcales bacterium]